MGYLTLGTLGFATAGAAANLVMGIARLMMTGLKVTMSLFTGVLKIGTAFVWLYQGAILAWNSALKLISGTLLAVRIAAMVAGISFSFMSWPVLLVVGAIALLAYGITKLIEHWDAIKAAVMNTTAFKVVSMAIHAVGEAFAQALKFILEGWKNLTAWFDNFSFTDSFAAMANGITDIFTGVWTWLKASFIDVYNGIVDVLNILPGVNIETNATGTTVGSSTPADAGSLLMGSQLKDVEKGGISRQISHNRTQSVDNSKRFDNVNIHVTNGMSPTDLAEWTRLENG